MLTITAGIADICSAWTRLGDGLRRRHSGPIVSRSNSFHDVVGEEEDCARDLQPQRPRGLEIDDQFELHGLLNGEVSRLSAF
jgi:hypothetical protein